MKIKKKITTEQIVEVEIETPFYCKDRFYFYRIDSEKDIVKVSTLIFLTQVVYEFHTSAVFVESALKDSEPCTKEEFESNREMILEFLDNKNN